MTTEKSNVIALIEHPSLLDKIEIPKSHLELIYKLTNHCYSTFMEYMANIAYEKTEGLYKGSFSEIEHEEKNNLLAKGMEIHFTELTANTYLEKGRIDSACFSSYFDDFYSFAKQSIQSPFLNLNQLNELNLKAYLDDAKTSIHGSTLDPFWIGFHHDHLILEREIDSSILLVLDFSHIIFDNFVESINTITAESEAELDSLNDEDTRALFNSLFAKNFETLLVKASNSAINEFFNIIIDPASKVMMKMMRYMEEGAFAFLQSKYIDFPSTFKGAKDITDFDGVVESFIDWSSKNQDIDSFTFEDIKALQLEGALTQYKSEAYDFIQNHSHHMSGMDPEERVIAIHARYMLIHDIYRRFMYTMCMTILEHVNTLLKNTPETFKDKEAQSLRENAAILIYQNEFTTEGLIKASYETWDELYPKTPLNINFEDEDDN
jgi:hypothetical protein